VDNTGGKKSRTHVRLASEQNDARRSLSSHPGGPLKVVIGRGLLTPGTPARGRVSTRGAFPLLEEQWLHAAFVPVTVAGAVPVLHRTSLGRQ